MKNYSIYRIFSSIARTLFLIIIFLFFVFPLFWMFITSFKSQVDAFAYPPSLIFKPTFINYILTFTGGKRGAYITIANFINSGIITLFTTLLCLMFGAPAAYAFSRIKFRGSGFMLFMVLVLRMIPPIVIVVPLYLLMRSLGLIDTRVAMIGAYVGVNLPFAVWLLKGFYDTIPVDMEEAGLIDGCSYWGIFFRIAIPLSAPGLATTAILIAIGAWNEFLLAIVLTREAVRPISVAIAGLDTQFETLWGLISAAGVIAVLPVVVFAFFVQKHLVRGLTMGAIK